MKNNKRPANNRNKPNIIAPPATAVASIAAAAAFKGSELQPSHQATPIIAAPVIVEASPVFEYCMNALVTPFPVLNVFRPYTVRENLYAKRVFEGSPRKR